MLATIAHKITAFILVFILFAHNINTLAIIGDFIINQDFIAKTLCIQKEAQKGCNGKCQLRKELAENNSDSSNSDNPLQETKRSSLDAFCLYKVNILEDEKVVLIESPLIFNSYSQNVIDTYLDIDTPPPNFC